MKGVTRQTGIISDIDEVKVCVRVTLPECDDLRTNWLPILQRNTQNNKDYWLPDIGEQVEVLLDDNGEDGVVLGAVYSSVDAAPVASLDKRYVQFADGAAFEYDRKEHQLTINGGIEKIVIEVKTSISITAPQVAIKGNVNVDGSINASGSIIDAGGNTNHHSH
ncbi:TPA: phage baseplate assembly protein V [Salmonella enterica]|nr:phage baseplate assembly protein V [Salmonella enterica]